MKCFDIELLEECAGEYIGLCRNCGEEKDRCEPDARGYTCDVCGKPTVYGAEELMLMGAFK